MAGDDNDEPRRTMPEMVVHYEAACKKGGEMWERLQQSSPPSRTSLTLQSCQYQIEKRPLPPNAVAGLQEKVQASGLLVRNLTYIDV